jgi:hypothetical protein
MNYIHHLSYSEYLDQAINGQPKEGSPAIHNRKSRQVKPSDDCFQGTATWEKAVELATEGWQEGREFIGQIVSQLDNIEARSVTLPQPVNDVTGDYVDIGAYLEGIPENMVRWEEQECPRRVVRILFNMAVSGAVSRDVIRWKGATVLALIDRLEASGVRVELDMVDSTEVKPHKALTFVTLKKAEEPLHLDRLAFHLVHPSSLRRLMFSLKECDPTKEVQRMKTYDGGGYGHPYHLTNDDPLIGAPYDLIVPEISIYSIEGAVREIERMFNTICPHEYESNEK